MKPIKNVLVAIAAAFGLAACNNPPKEATAEMKDRFLKDASVLLMQEQMKTKDTAQATVYWLDTPDYDAKAKRIGGVFLLQTPNRQSYFYIQECFKHVSRHESITALGGEAQAVETAKNPAALAPCK